MWQAALVYLKAFCTIGSSPEIVTAFSDSGWRTVCTTRAAHMKTWEQPFCFGAASNKRDVMRENHVDAVLESDARIHALPRLALMSKTAMSASCSDEIVDST